MTDIELELLLEQCEAKGIKTLGDLKAFCIKYDINKDNTKLLICLLLD